MAGKLSDELINISTMLMVAQERGDIFRATNALNEAILAVIETEERTGGLATEKEKALSTLIKFSKDEVMKMSKTFKKEFIANGCVAHVIKRPSGKSGYFYEIRYIEDQLTLCYHDLNITLKWSSPDIYKLEIEQGNIINLEHFVYGKSD